MRSFTGVKMELGYEMRKVTVPENADALQKDAASLFPAGPLVCEATSRHCFLDANGRPVRLKRDYPELYECLIQYVVPEDAK